MKIKITNEKLPLFRHSLGVKKLNFDMVIAETETETIGFNMEDVELMPENEYEELVLRYKDILKVKLETEVSPALYSCLIEYLEAEVGEKLESLEVLKDEFKISKRGIWEKRLVIVTNNKIPFQVVISAMKYSKKFNITLKDMELQTFINVCSEDLKLIKRDIHEKEKSIERHKRVLKEVLKNSIKSESDNFQKLIIG
jgi:hypothetical protein